MDATPTCNQQYYYCMLTNIPSSFHASDLRNYFSVFTEASKFNLFHFRHRPQPVIDTGLESSLSAETTTEPKTADVGEQEKLNAAPKRFCCPVRFNNELFAKEFVSKYNRRIWIDKMGNDLPIRCEISYQKLSADQITKFSSKEFRPPSFMPNGNIGCTNSHFLQLIRECRLPPSLIKKLGLEFPRLRKHKKYSKVPFDYGNTVEPSSEVLEEELYTAKGHEILNFHLRRPKLRKSAEIEDTKSDDAASDADDDNDRCEDWERHEALHDEVTTHGGIYSQTKERLYEEKIELKWEKGGSGLVFYTDAQFWDEQKGGFDERTTDDWDVDMEGYYIPGGGDKDAKDLLEMRQAERFQKGLEHISVFSRSESRYCQRRAKSPSPTPSSSQKIGDFEKHTKGIGRRLMEKAGWKDGCGIGKSTIGMADALENDGKGPRDKGGLGYYGEKLILGTNKKMPRKFNDYSLESANRVIIGTVFDKPEQLDVEEPLKRRNAPTFVKRYDTVKQPLPVHYN